MIPSPPPDAVRELALNRAVREAIGSPFWFIDDGPDLSSRVLGELWSIPEDGPAPGTLTPFCAVMAMATDAARGARAALLIHEFGSLFTLTRRADEMHTLAVAIGLVPGEADRWLGGGPVRQVRLRRAIEVASPELAGMLRTTYDILSDEVHGRTQSLAVYEDVHGAFAGPTIAEAIDPRRVRAAYMALLGPLFVHFGVLRWTLRGWHRLSPGLTLRAAAFCDALEDFTRGHLVHGDCQPSRRGTRSTSCVAP